MIEIYLDLCLGRPVDYAVAMQPPNVRPLVTLLVEAGSYYLRDQLFRISETRLMLHRDLAWSLAYASRLRDETWAALCIKKLAEAYSLGKKQRVEHVRYILAQCNQEWQTVLFDILLSDDRPRGARVLIRQDWAKIAAEFEDRIRETRAQSDAGGEEGEQSAGTDERGREAEGNEGSTAEAVEAMVGALPVDTVGSVTVKLEPEEAVNREGEAEEEMFSAEEEGSEGNRSDDDIDMGRNDVSHTGKRPAEDAERPPAQLRREFSVKELRGRRDLPRWHRRNRPKTWADTYVLRDLTLYATGF